MWVTNLEEEYCVFHELWLGAFLDTMLEEVFRWKRHTTFLIDKLFWLVSKHTSWSNSSIEQWLDRLTSYWFKILWWVRMTSFNYWIWWFRWGEWPVNLQSQDQIHLRRRMVWNFLVTGVTMWMVMHSMRHLESPIHRGWFEPTANQWLLWTFCERLPPEVMLPCKGLTNGILISWSIVNRETGMFSNIL